MKSVEIHTDGACSGNPGPGGWAAILIYNEHRKEISGFAPETTNNRMELTAAIEALKALRETCKVRLHSDSAYLCNAFQRDWLESWKHNGWKTSSKSPVENQDLWKQIVELTDRHAVEWIKVKGHSDDENNNRCDELARQAIKAAQETA